MIEINKIYHGSCLEVLKTFADNSIDSCATDPPYGISFMNKHWDYQIPSVEVWKEVLRVLKPGGYIICACGTRTQHRMAVNIEDAGFEIRDVITWHYGSGFPKSLNISKAIEKKKGIEGATINQKSYPDMRGGNYGNAAEVRLSGGDYLPVSEDGLKWNGWGTALKPATEFWTLARKPISEKTVAENVLKHGTGGLNIDGSRVEYSETNKPIPQLAQGKTEINTNNGMYGGNSYNDSKTKSTIGGTLDGRFPANVIFDEFTGKILDEQTGVLNKQAVCKTDNKSGWQNKYVGGNEVNAVERKLYLDEGGASRFFYCPKADNYERNKKVKNNHPTVKPIDLMRYLVKLITPKGGICIDPYCGSGTTCIGAKLELINYIGIEREEEYCRIAEARTDAWNPDKYKPQSLFT